MVPRCCCSCRARLPVAGDCNSQHSEEPQTKKSLLKERQNGHVLLVFFQVLFPSLVPASTQANHHCVAAQMAASRPADCTTRARSLQATQKCTALSL